MVQTALTRCVLVPAACLLLPPVTMSLLRSRNLLPKSKGVAMILELGVIYGSLQAAMPAALAVYPQVMKQCLAYCVLTNVFPQINHM